MNEWASLLALAATAAGALGVMVAYGAALEAPFVVPKFTVAEVSAVLGALALVMRRTGSGGGRWPRTVIAGVALVLGTSGLSWAVALTRPEGAHYGLDAMARWLALFGLAAGASVVERDRPRLVEAITFGAVAVAVIGLLQHWEVLPFYIPIISVPGSTFGNRNLAAEVMAVALPFAVAGMFGGRREARLAMLLAALAEATYLTVTRTRGAWLAGACGIAVVLVVLQGQLMWRHLVPRLLLVVAAIVVIAVVPARVNSRDTGDTKRYADILAVIREGFDTGSSAYRTRAGIWRRTLRMIGDHPWVGVGPGNWPVAFPRYAEPGAADDGVLSATLAPRQAHDDYLERTAESGVVGMAALIVLGVAVARAARRRIALEDEDERVVSAGAVGSLVTVAALVTSFPLEMPATVTVCGLALGLVVSAPAGEGSATEAERAPAWPRALSTPAIAVLLGCLVFVAVRGDRKVRASRALATADRALLNNRGLAGAEQALPELATCLELEPMTYLAELRTAQMRLRQKRTAEATDAALRTIAIEPYSPNGWGVLAAAHRAAGHAADARNVASHALELMHDYPLALDVRADAEEELGDAAAAGADRERIRELADHAQDENTRRTARGLASAAP